MAGFSLVGAAVKVAIVFGLLFLTLKLVARVNRLGGTTAALAGRLRPAAAQPVEVVTRAPLGRNAAFVVVRVGRRALALGVSEQSVNLLSEVDLDLAEDTDAPPARTPAPLTTPSPARTSFLEALRERTVRR